MEYMTCQEAAELWDREPRTIQIKCQNGEIKGAIKKGRPWFIPKSIYQVPFSNS